MAPLPAFTRASTTSVDRLAPVKTGPTLPLEPAAASVWQLPQPALENTLAPASGSPAAAPATVVVVVLVVVPTPPPPPSPPREWPTTYPAPAATETRKRMAMKSAPPAAATDHSDVRSDGRGIPRSSKVATPPFPLSVCNTFQKNRPWAAASTNTSGSDTRVRVS